MSVPRPFCQRHVWVSGRVQGVGYRAFTVLSASRFESMQGFVRNLSDGRVEAVFAGPEDEVLALVAGCREGPSGAKVTGLEVREEMYDPALPRFGVRATA